MIERLLRLVPRVSDRPGDLLELYELANGGELAAAAGQEAPADWLDAVRRHGASPPADIAVLLDHDRSLMVILIRRRDADPGRAADPGRGG